MENYVQYEMPLNIGLGDSWTVRAVGHGTMWLNMTLRTGVKKRLNRTLHIPNMARNLFSSQAINELGTWLLLDGADALCETSRERWWRLQH